MCHDDWVKVAMADDSLVVDLLLRLHKPPPPPCLNLHWTVRQRRSRSVPRHAAPHTKAESARASPTTPLSWSGATSASGGGGGLDASEESSLPSKLTETSRSHQLAAQSETATTKKSRRKKTLAELKEEENSLLKERRSLKNELASLRRTVEKHRATNESLKRMKLDLESRHNSSAATTSGNAVHGPSLFTKAKCHPSNSGPPKTVTQEVHDDNSLAYAENVSPIAQENGNQESTFVLPDLNLPVEEDFSPIVMS